MLSAPLNILISEIDTHSETKFFHCDEQGIFLHVFTNDKIVETIILKHTLCSKIFLGLFSKKGVCLQNAFSTKFLS